MHLVKCVAAILITVPLFGADLGTQTATGLTVHEWGTFTTVAGASGDPVEWMPLAGLADLPCFVYHLGGRNLKMEHSSVRMETPVLYFYSPRRMELSVHVDFPRGWITEWYPQASKVTPRNVMIPNGGSWDMRDGSIEWNRVVVTPGETPVLPVGGTANRYYAARNTDASPIRVGEQPEKLIFYRGIANFPTPLRVEVTDGNRLELRNIGKAVLPLAILFENRAGKIGYRVARDLGEATVLDSPELTGDLARLKQELAEALVAGGLYPKEALAMIDTWHDSWFEEGMRVFYLTPRLMVDAVLPLTVTPAPAATQRVFVGRVEVLSPYEKGILTTALAGGDTATLQKYGRFLEPFAQQLRTLGNAKAASFINARFGDVKQQFESPACVK